jgi:hypothetical protein
MNGELQLMSGMTVLGSCLMRDQTLSSPDAAIILELPTRPGRLNLMGPGGLIWSPAGMAPGVQANRACIGPDGNLRLLHIDGSTLWSSVRPSSTKRPFVAMHGDKPW